MASVSVNKNNLSAGELADKYPLFICHVLSLHVFKEIND